MQKMTLEEIDNYLLNFNEKILRQDIPSILLDLKREEVIKGSEDKAKQIWCFEQIYKITNHYLTAFNQIQEKEFFKAWCELDRADIALTFLRKHFDYTHNKYRLELIEKHTRNLQRLFPYQYFMSRETIVKKWYCSICNKQISLRKSCGHKVGEIYNGEHCLRVAGDIEFLAIAIVTDPFDKYTVIFPEGLEYNYTMLENLFSYLEHPFENWDLKIFKKIKPEYENLGKNRMCICKSGKKYKMCCMKSSENLYDHYHIIFYEKNPEDFKPLTNQFIHTWKN
jgi:hypothetical protein